MTVPLEDLIVTAAVFDTGGGLFKVDGMIEDQRATGDIPITGFTIGRRFTEAQPLAGDIAELIVYNRRLSDPEIHLVEGYLFVKWLTEETLDPAPSVVTLGVRLQDGQLSPYWPVAAQGFVPQQAGGLPPIEWSAVDGEVVEQDGYWTVAIEPSAERQYFRLAR